MSQYSSDFVVSISGNTPNYNDEDVKEFKENF